jgi:5-hydroxyisourate hydrolase-like protein (transthyretin family)
METVFNRQFSTDRQGFTLKLLTRTTYILTIFFLSVRLYGQTDNSKNVVFTGTVLDYETGKPIPDFEIHLMRILMPKQADTIFISAKTDTAGKFIIENVPKIGTYLLYKHPDYMSRRDYRYGGQFQDDVTTVKRFHTIKYATINIDSLAPYFLNKKVEEAIKLAHFNEDCVGKGGYSTFATSTTGCEESWTTTHISSITGDSTEVTLFLEKSGEVHLEQSKVKYKDKTVHCVQWTDKSGAIKKLGNCWK